MPIYNSIAAFHDEMTAWRRDLHANPEIGFEETRTAAFVASKLREWGVEVHEGVAGTGVIGVLRGTGSGDRSVGLRADIDALPMTEETGVPHASTIAGRMHGCGHDGHTVMLLGAARHLAQTRNFDGTVVLIFQPAEEVGGQDSGGARMVREGLFDRFPVETVWGLHNSPNMPFGTIGVRTGPAMAASDSFDVTIVGKGGHAARPQTTIDPIAVGTQLYQAFQTVVSRNADPVESAVLSVTIFQSGEAFNVIPARARLAGTVRTYRPAVRDMIECRMGEICAGLAAAHGCTITLSYSRGYPALITTATESAFAADVARAVVGDAMVDADIPPVMGGEDFAYMLQKRPGSFVRLGTGRGPDTPLVHHPRYDFDDEALPIGASFWVKLVETAMPRPA
jgi:amidohydrolase